MRKIVFLSLLLVSSVYGQEKKFTISGVVTDCKTKEGISGVTIRLIGRDKSSAETKSDSLGHYSFSNCFKNNTDYILTTQVGVDVGLSPGIKYGICPEAMTENYGYLNSSDKIKFTYSDTLSSKQYDFCLSSIIGCGPPPTFYFKKNSTDFSGAEWIKQESADTAIDCYVEFLMVHKTWVIELSGHSCSDEKDKKELAEARVKKFYDLLVSKGIDKERLVYKSYSDTRPTSYFSEKNGKWIENDKKSERNRRIDIGLLRKDYDPTTKKPKVDLEEKKQNKESEEDE